VALYDLPAGIEELVFSWTKEDGQPEGQTDVEVEIVI